MIIKILTKNKEMAINVYENNFNGDIEVLDTSNCEIIDDNCFDDIFNTNDKMIIIKGD